MNCDLVWFFFRWEEEEEEDQTTDRSDLIRRLAVLRGFFVFLLRFACVESPRWRFGAFFLV